MRLASERFPELPDPGLLLLGENSEPALSEKLSSLLQSRSLSVPQLLSSLPPRPEGSFPFLLGQRCMLCRAMRTSEDTTLCLVEEPDPVGLTEFLDGLLGASSTSLLLLVDRNARIVSAGSSALGRLGTTIGGANLRDMLDQASALSLSSLMDSFPRERPAESGSILFLTLADSRGTVVRTVCCVQRLPGRRPLYLLNMEPQGALLPERRPEEGLHAPASLIDLVPIPGFTIDTRGIITRANSSAVSLALDVSGIRPEGTHFAEWLDPASRDRVTDVFLARIEGREAPESMRARVLVRDPRGSVEVDIRSFLLPGGDEVLAFLTPGSRQAGAGTGGDDQSAARLSSLLREYRHSDSPEKEALRLLGAALGVAGIALLRGDSLLTVGEVPVSSAGDLARAEMPLPGESLWKESGGGLWELTRRASDRSGSRVALKAYGIAGNSLDPLGELSLELFEILLDHQDALRALRTAMRGFSSITEAAEALTRGESSIRDLLRRLAPVLDADHLLVTRIEPGRDELRPVSGFGFTEHAPAFPLREESVQTWVYKHREPVYVSDSSSDTRFRLVSEAAASEICVPLWIRGTAGGAFSAASVRKEAFTNHDLSLLRFFSILVSLWLQQAQTAAAGQPDAPRRTATAHEVPARETLSDLSHELLAPLTAIGGYADMLSGRDEDTPGQAAAASGLRSASARLSFHVERLLCLLRCELDPGSLEQRWEKPCEMLGSIKPSIEPLVESAGMSISFTCSPEDLAVRTSSESFEQMLLSLVDNSVRFGRPGGRIEVLIEAEGDSHWKLEVRDDGRGIPADTLPRIFDRFFRTPDPSGREGMGLGLALVKRLSELQGGTVAVWSREGQGASFTVRCPTST
ncbi:GAF domain-containing protein [Candidatus Fermentibacterales bacterium]|nr:GAF domain-containing protein [Candidatus Fermentibacterales bacterium]